MVRGVGTGLRKRCARVVAVVSVPSRVRRIAGRCWAAELSGIGKCPWLVEIAFKTVQ